MSSRSLFDDLTFERFRQLALEGDLSSHEKVGFPNEYREGKEQAIFADISRKLTALHRNGLVALDIGPGCSQLPVMLAEACRTVQGEVHLVDSAEMLQHLPDGPHIHKWAACFPDSPELLRQLAGKVDVIVCYSVIQYVFAEGNIWDFIDRCLLLLTDGGQMLIGDIPNLTMRKRLFSSNQGLNLHREYTGRDEVPDINFNTIELGRMDDSVVLSILARVRAQGFHCWVVPQASGLPMANRREDILICKP